MSGSQRSRRRALPEDTESLRKALKLEAVSWLCMAAKFRSKTWLHGLEPSHWTKGERVLGLKFNVDGQTHSVRPPWSVIFGYEQKMRKEVFKWVQAGTHTHYSRGLDNKWQRPNTKGKSSSKGTKGGKGKSARDFNSTSLDTHTRDGRELCFAFNAQGCSGKCGRVHACRVRGCYGKHAAREHHK